MPLPKKMKYDQLKENGFTVDPNNRGTARHNRFVSVRYYCADCGFWVHQATGPRDEFVCLPCDIKRMKSGR